LIVAEIGQNFTDMWMAKDLISLAYKGGADLAKFQLFDSVKLYGEYQDTELTKEQASELFAYGKVIGIEVFFSVFDVERVKWCEEMGVKRYKLAYSQRRNPELIKTLMSLRREVIISDDTPTMLIPSGKIPPISKVLQCVPKYPARIQDYKLKQFGAFDGISDHTIGLDCAKIAISRGAKIIEKHFCFNHQTGVDAEWSMDYDELKELRRFYDICTDIL
jgi:sialic acid synthase SpsE